MLYGCLPGLVGQPKDSKFRGIKRAQFARQTRRLGPGPQHANLIEESERWGEGGWWCAIQHAGSVCMRVSVCVQHKAPMTCGHGGKGVQYGPQVWKCGQRVCCTKGMTCVPIVGNLFILKNM